MSAVRTPTMMTPGNSRRQAVRCCGETGRPGREDEASVTAASKGKGCADRPCVASGCQVPLGRRRPGDMPRAADPASVNARGGIRTHDLRLRRPTLYPTELLAQTQKELAGELPLPWSGRVDLNHRPPGPEPGALTGLRHAPRMNPRARFIRRARRDSNSQPSDP